MSLRETLSKYWYASQQELFPSLEMEIAPLRGRCELFVAAVEFARLKALLSSICSLSGRPPQNRAALARAFIAKAVFDIPTAPAKAQEQQFNNPGATAGLCNWIYTPTQTD